MKKTDENRDENGQKSEEETSGVATGSNEDSRSSGSEPHSTDGDDVSEKEEKLYDSVDGGIGEENLPNGYESTKPVNLKRESKSCLNPQGKGGGQDFIWNLAKGISQESGDGTAENPIQALLQGKELILYLRGGSKTWDGVPTPRERPNPYVLLIFKKKHDIWLGSSLGSASERTNQ